MKAWQPAQALSSLCFENRSRAVAPESGSGGVTSSATSPVGIGMSVHISARVMKAPRVTGFVSLE